MIFGAAHYVPVLKVKRGEKRAIRDLASGSVGEVTPLLEIVERTDKPLDAHLDTAFEGLARSLEPFSRCFLDAREAASGGSEAALTVFERARAEGISFTPVTGITRAADVGAALAHAAGGLALRITREEMEAGIVPGGLDSFLREHALEPERVDLVLDLGAVGDLVAEGIAAMTEAFLAAILHIERWRTVTSSACAFPLSMGLVERHSHELVERAEWIAWRDFVHARRGEIPRVPTFSDCAIQHPRGVEGFDPIRMQVSAAVRYATRDHWLLIKGESTRRTPPGSQFPKLARRLVHGDLAEYFYGPEHCEGCRAIRAAADGAPKLGSAEVWRRIGTVHHLRTVLDQLAATTSP